MKKDENNNESTNLGIVIVAVVIIGILIFFGKDALVKTEHSPTFIIDKSTEEGYWYDRTAPQVEELLDRIPD